MTIATVRFSRADLIQMAFVRFVKQVPDLGMHEAAEYELQWLPGEGVEIRLVRKIGYRE